MTLGEIDDAYPDLVKALVAHPGIGLLMVRTAAHGPIAVGKKGIHFLDEDRVEGEDPLALYGDLAARPCGASTASTNVGDIALVSLYDPETGEIAAFEELIGAHGGLGGAQTRPFLLYPADWELDQGPLIGAPMVYRQLRRWMERHLGMHFGPHGRRQRRPPRRRRPREPRRPPRRPRPTAPHRPPSDRHEAPSGERRRSPSLRLEEPRSMSDVPDLTSITRQVVAAAYRAFATRDIPALLALLDPAVAWGQPDNPGIPSAGTRHGLAGVQEWLRIGNETEEDPGLPDRAHDRGRTDGRHQRQHDGARPCHGGHVHDRLRPPRHGRLGPGHPLPGVLRHVPGCRRVRSRNGRVCAPPRSPCAPMSSSKAAISPVSGSDRLTSAMSPTSAMPSRRRRAVAARSP